MFHRLNAAVAAITLLAAGLVSAQTAPTAATKPLSDLKISLMDGSLLTGKLSVSELAIDTKFGPLKVPVDQILSFAPGLQSHLQFQQTLNGLVNDLGADAFADREKAQQALTKLGPDIRGELDRQLKLIDKATDERATRLQKILEDFDAMQDEDADKSHAWVGDDVIVTAGFTVVGHITTPGFSIAGNYGKLDIKMADVREGRRDAAVPEDIRKTISVPGTVITQHSYIGTGIKLAKGDQVSITATGTITMTPFGNRQATPDGSPNVGSVNGMPNGTLVARVGDSGAMIKVGSKFTWTADRAGNFQLGIACPEDYSSYTFPGEYQVKIRVVKK
jgi:hypothetical protein